MTKNLTIGNATANNWRTTISDIPGHDLDMRLIDNKVRSWTSPSLGLTSVTSSYGGYEANFQNPDQNRGGYDLNMTLAVSEDWINYYAFCSWLLKIRRGEVDSPHNEFLMGSVKLFLLDSSKRERMAITLYELQLENVSGLTGVSGTSEEFTFDIQLKASDIDIELFGVNNDAPSIVTSAHIVPQAGDGSLDTPIEPYKSGL